MNVRPDTSLSPVVKTEAEISERHTVRVKALEARSVHGYQLWRKVQNLPKLHFTSAQFLLCSFRLSDVDHSAHVFNEMAGRAENRVTDAVNVPDGATRMHNTIVHFFV